MKQLSSNIFCTVINQIISIYMFLIYLDIKNIKSIADRLIKNRFDLYIV